MFHSLFINIYYVFAVPSPPPLFFVYLNEIGGEAVACMQLPCKKPQPLVAATSSQKAFAVLWVTIPRNEASEPSDEMSPVQGVCENLMRQLGQPWPYFQLPGHSSVKLG